MQAKAQAGLCLEKGGGTQSRYNKNENQTAAGLRTLPKAPGRMQE